MQGAEVSTTTPGYVTRDAPNWKAAADVAAARRAELKLTQEEVIERMGDARINVEAYRRFERVDQESYRRTTLAAISVALDWDAGHLWDLAHAGFESSPTELDRLRKQVEVLRAIVEHMAGQAPEIQHLIQKLDELEEPRG